MSTYNITRHYHITNVGIDGIDLWVVGRTNNERISSFAKLEDAINECFYLEKLNYANPLKNIMSRIEDLFYKILSHFWRCSNDI